jgi:hypothetical protein
VFNNMRVQKPLQSRARAEIPRERWTPKLRYSAQQDAEAPRRYSLNLFRPED